MKIAICGKNRNEIINELKKEHDYPIIKTKNEMIQFPEMDYLISTYDCVDKQDVLFDGGVFDVYRNYIHTGHKILQEQLTLSYIQSMDKIIVDTKDMSTDIVNAVKEYEELYPNIIEIR
ncbi:MAG: hypothetical protein NC548_27540 [Lachnospiraceae bacterium]|nr:hypothetical protein [Lachnospiraceae bacterium]